MIFYSILKLYILFLIIFNELTYFISFCVYSNLIPQKGFLSTKKDPIDHWIKQFSRWQVELVLKIIVFPQKIELNCLLSDNLPFEKDD